MRSSILAGVLLLTIATTRWLQLETPELYIMYSTMAWDACRFGPPSCSPVFHPVADGAARLLTCTPSGWCGLHTYTYWTDENCNRLTACAAYKPHRGDHDPR